MKIGVLGGGQLARMLCASAHQLGIDLVCVDPNPDCAASNITRVLHAQYDDFDQIKQFFSGVKCVTYETENLPLSALEKIAHDFNFHPSIQALKIFQDRLYEKNFLNALKIPTADYMEINSWDELQQAITKIGYPFLIKTRTAGYDGKGQALVNNDEEAQQSWARYSHQPIIIEKKIKFDFELSIISVRNADGEILFYPLVYNQHKNGILYLSQAPYDDPQLESIARQYASMIIKEMDYVGVMAIEFFCCNEQLIANEVAPRVHNSGHWTIEGSEISQFENHLRAVLGLPLGSTRPRFYSAMINIIGKKPNLEKILSIPDIHFHWYHKEPFEGRKLGHLSLCATDQVELQGKIAQAFELLNA